MFKKLWAKLKGLLTSSVKAKLIEEIDNLDKYEDELAGEIDKRVSSEKIAKTVIDFIQDKLKDLVEAIL